MLMKLGNGVLSMFSSFRRGGLIKQKDGSVLYSGISIVTGIASALEAI